jgi:hypothetical protein
MNEQDILQQIAETEVLYAEAQVKMREAKKVWIEAESLVIEHKINLENLREQLRMHEMTTPNYKPTLREQDIEAFRLRMPELLKKV